MKNRTSQGPVVKKISVSDIPKMNRRGREAFILTLPFWNSLVQDLKKGLGVHEALEIDLAPVEDLSGNRLDESQLASRIRYQFHKTGLSKKYSLLMPKKSRVMFVVDHETAAETSLRAA